MIRCWIHLLGLGRDLLYGAGVKGRFRAWTHLHEERDRPLHLKLQGRPFILIFGAGVEFSRARNRISYGSTFDTEVQRVEHRVQKGEQSKMRAEGKRIWRSLKDVECSRTFI